MEPELIKKNPFPVYLARESGFRPSAELTAWYHRMWLVWRADKSKLGFVCRGVNLDRIESIFEKGIDVAEQQIIWADMTLDKAWEYGGPCKVVMILSREFLERSYQILPLDTPEKELEEFSKTYKTQIITDTEIFISRLPPDDPRVCSPYEMNYGWSIVGNPKKALVALLIVVPGDYKEDEIIARILSL